MCIDSVEVMVAGVLTLDHCRCAHAQKKCAHVEMTFVSRQTQRKDMHIQLQMNMHTHVHMHVNMYKQVPKHAHMRMHEHMHMHYMHMQAHVHVRAHARTVRECARTCTRVYAAVFGNLPDLLHGTK